MSLAAAPRAAARPAVRVRVARVPAAAWTVALATVLRVAYGPPQTGYDVWWALAWGRQVAHGAVPDLTAPVAPTPHPLAILVAVPVSVFGDGAPAVLGLLSLLAFAACGVAAGLLSARLFGPVAGALAAAILLTRPLLVGEALQGSADVPFLALTLGAGAALARGRDRKALCLLALAGLLRPEAWLLALIAAGWSLRAPSDRRDRAATLALVLAAPALWLLTDLVCTGDPLHSLHGTRELADGLGRPQSLATAFRVAPDYLTVVLGDGVALLGAAAAIAAVWLIPRRAALPLATLGAGLAGFLVLGVAELPLLYRYTLLPAAALALLAAWAPTALRGRAAPLSVLAVVVLCATVPSAWHGVQRQVTDAHALAREQQDLITLVRAPAVAARLERCGPPLLAQRRPVPQLAYLLGRSPAAIRVGGTAPAAGVVLVPKPGSRAAADRLAPADAPRPAPAALRDARRLDARGAWTALARC
jgi:hypothetical protein